MQILEDVDKDSSAGKYYVKIAQHYASMQEYEVLHPDRILAPDWTKCCSAVETIVWIIVIIGHFVTM